MRPEKGTENDMETQSTNHHAAIRDAGLTLADAILDLAEAQVEADRDKHRIDNARALLRAWIGTGKAPAMPPSDLMFAIAVVLDTVELPTSNLGLGTEMFAQLIELGLGDGVAPTAYAREPIPLPPTRPVIVRRCCARRPTPRPWCCASAPHCCA